MFVSLFMHHQFSWQGWWQSRWSSGRKLGIFQYWHNSGMFAWHLGMFACFQYCHSSHENWQNVNSHGTLNVNSFMDHLIISSQVHLIIFFLHGSSLNNLTFKLTKWEFDPICLFGKFTWKSNSFWCHIWTFRWNSWSSNYCLSQGLFKTAVIMQFDWFLLLP